MSAIGDIVVNLVARTKQFTSPLTSAIGDLQAFSGRVLQITGMVGALTAGLSVAGVAGWGVSLAVEAEQAQIAFKTMLGSATAAKSLLGELSTFAATTPYESPEVVSAAKQLLAYGVQAGEIIPTLRQLGDVASGVGAPIGDLAYLFGTAKTQGRLFSADINQFTNRGIPIIKALAATMGAAEGDVKKLVEAGRVGFPELQSAFTYMTRAGSQFGGMMAEQSRSIGGMWSTLKDGLGLTLRQIAEDLFAAFDVRGILEGTIVAVSGFQQFLSRHRSELAAIAVVLKVVAGAVGILTSASLAYAVAQRTATVAAIVFQSVMNPANLVKIAAGLAAAGLVVAAMDSQFASLSAAAAESTASIEGVAPAAVAAASAVASIGEEMSFGAGKAADLANRLQAWQSAQPDAIGVMPDLPKIMLGEKLFPDVDKKSAELQSLHNLLQLVYSSADKLGEARTADFAQQILDQIGQVSGIAGAIADAKRQLESMQSSRPEQAQSLAKFREAGATDEQIREYERLLNSIEAVRESERKLREQQQARGRGLSSITALKDEIDLLKGVATQADIELRKLHREGVPPDQLAEIDRLLKERDALKKDDTKSPGGKPGEQFAAALTRGSSEALAAINNAKYGQQSPTKKLEDIAAKQLKAQEETAAGVMQLAATRAGESDDLIADFG